MGIWNRRWGRAKLDMGVYFMVLSVEILLMIEIFVGKSRGTTRELWGKLSLSRRM